MMPGVKSRQLQLSDNQTQPTAERDRVVHLIQTATAAGVRVDPATIINCYVSLKSKPLNILVGPARSGKIALIQSLTRILAGESHRCQLLDGHAWWAGHTGNVALFTEVQTRFTSAKILALVEEALQPVNANRVFIACLTRISPAELNGYFSEVAFQLGHGQLMRLPGAHLLEPIPYPPNLFLLGTMDTTDCNLVDADLLSKANIIHWPAVEAEGTEYPAETGADCPEDETSFLHACIRNEKAARQKLHRILGNFWEALGPLMAVEGLAECWGVSLPGSVTDEVLIYLANAWSPEGIGLFNGPPSENLAIALDFATAQTILPRVARTVQYSAARRDWLQQTLHAFPYSEAYLTT